MAVFKYVRGEQEIKKVLIANSAAIKVGAPVKLTAGYAVPTTAGATTSLGMCIGVQYENGKPVEDIDYGDTFTAASDNVTVAKVYAIVSVCRDTEWEATADDTLGTTSLSNLPFTFFDVASADIGQLDESTASASTGTFVSVAVDTASAKLIVRFNETLIY